MPSARPASIRNRATPAARQSFDAVRRLDPVDRPFKPQSDRDEPAYGVLASPPRFPPGLCAFQIAVTESESCAVKLRVWKHLECGWAFFQQTFGNFVAPGAECPSASALGQGCAQKTMTVAAR